MVNKRIVDYGSVEVIIKKIESVFEEHELDFNEKKFILTQISSRIDQTTQQAKAQDMIGNMNLKDIVKRSMGFKGKEEEEE